MATETWVSPPLSRPYLPNHLGAVMGPVQLSELSQELKPVPARGPGWETARGGPGCSCMGEGWRTGPGWAEGLSAVTPWKLWGEHEELFAFGGARHRPMAQEGKPRQEAGWAQVFLRCSGPMQ